MNHLDVGLDKGCSKTNLAVVDADRHVLLEARIEHFDRASEQRITDERLLHTIAQHLTPFRAYPLYLFGSHVGTTRSFFDGLRAHGLDVQVLEAFNDTHMHYGLTDMSGNAVTVACGSHWNAMYYDCANNVHCLASPRGIWYDVPHRFDGIGFARFLLSWWREAWDQRTLSALADEIVACTALSPQALRDTVENDPLLDTLYPARWLALGPLVSQYANEEAVAAFLDQGMRELQQLYDRFCAQVNPPRPPLLVLGGSIWSSILFERVGGALLRAGIPVRHSRGNPARGAIWFRRTNPGVQLEPWAYRVTI
jgi:hypothetical protein